MRAFWSCGLWGATLKGSGRRVNERFPGVGFRTRKREGEGGGVKWRARSLLPSSPVIASIEAAIIPLLFWLFGVGASDVFVTVT